MDTSRDSRAINGAPASWTAAALRRFVLLALLGLLPGLVASEEWQVALSQMPLGANVAELNRTNCAKLCLGAFQSNQVVKALVFMPGATDELYFFRRAKARLTNSAPTLWDAIRALTNQTHIRASFRPPLLLLHSEEDLLDPEIKLQDVATCRKLKAAPFLPYVLYNDRDWDYLQPILARQLAVSVRPQPYCSDSWHFYRHSFAAWNLTGWEAVQAISLAGETSVTIGPQDLLFQGDTRFRAAPKVEAIPR